MSADFGTAKTLNTRKQQRCYECARQIAKGERAVRSHGRYDGGWYRTYCHLDCDEAARAYADLHGAYGEEWPFFADGEDFEHSDRKWMVENYPAVATRLGWDVRVREYETDMAEDEPT